MINLSRKGELYPSSYSVAVRSVIDDLSYQQGDSSPRFVSTRTSDEPGKQSRPCTELLSLSAERGNPGNWVTLISGNTSAESWLSRSPMRPLIQDVPDSNS
jgi:hypothetical protein